MNHGLLLVVVLNAGGEVIALSVMALDSAAEVVTAIDDISNPGEAALIVTAAVGLSADVHLGMSQNVGIAGTTEGIVDTSVAQVHIGVAANVTFVTATIYIFCLGKVLNYAFA